MPEIIFYDIPGKTTESKAWSPNTWNTRLALNYKNLEYRTEWIEYPDIEALCKKIGAAPTSTKADGITPHYTLPVIFDPSTNTVLSDSTAIADYLDKTYPEKPLYPAGTRALHAALDTALSTAVFTPLFLLSVLATCSNLNPPSYAYYKRTREAAYGKLEALAPDNEKGEEVWKQLEAGTQKMTGWFKAHGDKPFIGGDELCYADIQIAAILTWARKVLGTGSERWARIKALDGGRWDRYLQKFDKYMTVA